MTHSHSHSHDQTGNFRVAFFLNLGFTIFEIIGGLYTNSLAILSDAVHDLGDSLSLGMAWYLEKHVLTTRLVVEENADKEALMQIKRQANRLTAGMGLEHATIELEFEDEDCSMNGMDLHEENTKEQE